MATTAGEIIEQAREYHPLFSPQNVPELGALKALARLETQLANAVVMEAPQALAQWYEIDALPEAWEDGVVLPPHLQVIAADVIYEDRAPVRMEVKLVQATQSLTQPHLYPSVYVLNGRLFFTDLRQWFGTLHGWEDLVTLRILYVPEVADLTTNSQEITLPDTAVSALVPNLALWMADRVGAGLPTLRQSAEQSGQGWVAHMLNKGSANTWMVEVVEP